MYNQITLDKNFLTLRLGQATKAANRVWNKNVMKADVSLPP